MRNKISYNFNIVDLGNNKVIETLNCKGSADRRFKELQDNNPNKRFVLKISNNKRKTK